MERLTHDAGSLHVTAPDRPPSAAGVLGVELVHLSLSRDDVIATAYVVLAGMIGGRPGKSPMR
jgi:hypothetical protein